MSGFRKISGFRRIPSFRKMYEFCIICVFRKFCGFHEISEFLDFPLLYFCFSQGGRSHAKKKSKYGLVSIFLGPGVDTQGPYKALRGLIRPLRA